MNSQSRNKYYPLYLLLPILMVFTIFYILPALLGLMYSLTDARINSTSYKFIGFENYRILFSEGSVLITSIWNQFKFAILDAGGKTVFGLLIALLLNKKFFGNAPLRAIVYMPIMFGNIVVGIIFNYILKHEGFLNNILTAVGLGGLARDWLGDFDLALFSVIAVDIWVGLGFTTLLILAALQTVPKELLESSDMDGAGPVREFFSIKLPFILHAINLSFLLSIITGLKAFDIIYALTGGGPGNATEVMTTLLVKSMSSGSLGYPAAISVVQFLIITTIALLINRYTSGKEHEA